MKDKISQAGKPWWRKWGEIALGICIGSLTLGSALLVYIGIKHLARSFGKELPEISDEIKQGTLVGLVVIASVFGTIFSGGFAAPAIPALIAGTVTTIAGIGTIALSSDAKLEQRVVAQQEEIAGLKGIVHKLYSQKGGVEKDPLNQQTTPPGAAQEQSEIEMDDDGNRATRRVVVGAPRVPLSDHGASNSGKIGMEEASLSDSSDTKFVPEGRQPIRPLKRRKTDRR